MRTAEIDIDEARKAFFLMVGFIALIWVLQIFNWVGHYRLDYDYGILPRNIGRLPQIFSAPFLHFSWDHIEGNSGPLFVFGFLAAYRGVKKFLGVTLIVAVTSGLAVWLFQGGHELTVGASGLIFGYFGYVLDLPDPARRLRDGPGQGSRRPWWPSARHYGGGIRGQSARGPAQGARRPGPVGPGRPS
jgi:membrane associated rhomboid family serine protease